MDATESSPPIAIAGGGFFGCAIALMLQRRGLRPVIVEAADDLLTCASRVNQARIHGGYHYPRSLMTAYRSRHNYERFKATYREAVVDQFTKIYAVARLFSKVDARQFEEFMRRIGAPLREAPAAVGRHFNPSLIEKVWIAEECAFDCEILKHSMRRQLIEADVEIRLRTRIERVESHANGAVAQLSDGSELPAGLVINATYAGLNEIAERSGLPLIPLKHELAEMALIELPPELRGLSVTLMCGPFFSFMPYPSRGLTTLSHVRYTPHASWLEGPGLTRRDPYDVLAGVRKQTSFEFMKADAARYVPALSKANYCDSLWAVKTVLPQTEVDDGRPILFKRDPVLPALVHVMGGKIDNIFDVEDEIDALLQNPAR